MSTKWKRIVFFVILLCVAVSLALVVGDRRYDTRATYSEFLEQVQAGEVTKATITSADSGATPVTYSLKSGARLQTIVPRDYNEALAAMRAKLVNVEIRNSPGGWSFALNSLPFLSLLAFWVVAMFWMKNKPRGTGFSL